MLLGCRNQRIALHTILDSVPGDVRQLAVDTSAREYAISVNDADDRLQGAWSQPVIRRILILISIIGLFERNAA